MFISNALQNAHSIDQVVELINSGSCEGMEGIEFSSEQLAGQYAWSCAKEAGYGVGKTEIEAQLELISEHGAKFDLNQALDLALKFGNPEKMYMNPETGSVDSYDGWGYEKDGVAVNAVDLGEVVEVEKDENGDWVEV